MGGVGSVQRVFQRLGWLEADRGGFLNLQGFPCAWVAPGAGCALLCLECAEAVDGDFLAVAQGVGNVFQKALNDACHISAWVASMERYGLKKIGNVGYGLWSGSVLTTFN